MKWLNLILPGIVFMIPFSSCDEQITDLPDVSLPTALSETPLVGIEGAYILEPQLFVRTDEELTVYEIELSFNPCMCFTAPYYLTVLNGDSYGNYNVTSAKVSVDGNVIFNQSDFKKKVETLNQEIDVHDLSILKIEIMGKPGTQITVSVEGKLEDCEWNQTYGGSSNDNGYGFIGTEDYGYIFTGRTFSSDGDVTGGPGTWVVKLNHDGDIIWERSYSDNKGYYNIKKSVQDGYILSSNAGVMQIDLTGNRVWDRSAPNNAIIQRTDLNYVMVYGLNRQISILDQNGDFYPGYPINLNNFYGICLIEDHISELNTVIAGLNYNSSTSGLFGALKVDVNGSVVWQKDYNNSPETPIAITQDSSGDFVLVGTDFQTLKFGPDGALKWMKYVVPDNYTYDIGGIANVVVNSSNGYIIAGYLKNVSGTETGDTQYYDGWVVEIDHSGNELRSKYVGGLNDDRVFGVCEYSPEFVVIGGYSKSFHTDADYDYWAEKICFN